MPSSNIIIAQTFRMLTLLFYFLTQQLLYIWRLIIFVACFGCGVCLNITAGSIEPHNTTDPTIFL